MPRDRKKALKDTEQALAKRLQKQGLAPSAARTEARRRMKTVRTGSFWFNEKNPSP